MHSNILNSKNRVFMSMPKNVYVLNKVSVGTWWNCSGSLTLKMIHWWFKNKQGVDADVNYGHQDFVFYGQMAYSILCRKGSDLYALE